MTLKSKIFKDSLIVNAASVIEKIVFFIVNIIIARYLSVEHFGEYSTALSYATFFSTMTDIGINASLIRFLNLEKKSENEHFTNAFFAKLSLAIMMYMLMAFSLMFMGYKRDVINLTLILGLVRIGNEFMKTFYALDEAKQRFLFPSVVNSLYVVMFLLSVVAVIVMQGNYYHICIVRLVVVYFFIAFLAIHVFKKVRLLFNKELFFKFVKITIPFATITVLSNLTFRINAIIISLILGTREVGFFNNSILFIDTLSIIPGNLRRIMLPAFYETLEKNDIAKFQFSFDIMSKLFALVSFYILLIFFLYAEFIIALIFGDKYAESAVILEIIAFSFPFVFNVASIILVGRDRQDILSKVMVFSTITNILANIVFINLFAIEGAAIAVLLTYGVIFFISHYYLRKIEKIKMVPAFKKYIIIIAIAFAVCLLFNFIASKVSVFYSFVIVTFAYGILSFVLVIDKDDIRIIKESIGLK